MGGSERLVLTLLPVISSVTWQQGCISHTLLLSVETMTFGPDNVPWHQGIKANTEDAPVLALAALINYPSMKSQREAPANEQIIEFFFRSFEVCMLAEGEESK